MQSVKVRANGVSAQQAAEVIRRGLGAGYQVAADGGADVLDEPTTGFDPSASPHAGSPGRQASSNLDVMAKVRVPRKNVTPGELVNVLGHRLGGEYKIEANGDGRVVVRRGPVSYATISIADTPGATVFRVHGGGLAAMRLVNAMTTARRVADALRRSPEFRSL
jgi:hypothetical protein